MSTPLTMPDTIAAALTWSGYCESSCFHALGRRGVGAIVPAEYVDSHDLPLFGGSCLSGGGDSGSAAGMTLLDVGSAAVEAPVLVSAVAAAFA